jgi:hypothetical protein
MTSRELARMRAERRAIERAERLDAIWGGVAIGAPVLALWLFFRVCGWLMTAGIMPC